MEKAMIFPAITFSERVDQFWASFKALEKEMRDSFSLDGSRSENINKSVSMLLDALFQHDTSFSIYKNPGEKRINFDISPQGNDIIKILGQHAIDRHPAMKGWSFALYHRPRAIGNLLVSTGNDAIIASSLSFHPSIDEKNEKIDVVLESDGFRSMDENQRFDVAFLFLDRLLGERVVEDRVGKISFDHIKQPGSMPISSIPRFVEEMMRKSGWKPVPDEAGFVYSFNAREADEHAPAYRSRRDDIIVGSTKYPKLILDYLNGEHARTEQLQGTGADFMYATIDQSEMRQPDPGKTSATLAWSVHDDINHLGIVNVIGHAIGRKCTYFDLAVFDGERSIVAIDAVLKKRLQAKRVRYGFFRAALGSKFIEIVDGAVTITNEDW